MAVVHPGAFMSVVLSTVPAQALRADVAVVPGEQEFSFGNADFERIRQLIYKRAGSSLHAGKQAMVYSRLSRRLRETGHRSFVSYLKWLERPSGAAGAEEWQEVVNRLTTNLAAFFAEEPHRIPAAQPDGAALATGRAVRHRVLPQRDDLFRCTDAAPRARADSRGDEAAWPVVRRPFGEFLRVERLVPPARQDDLRARVSSVSFTVASALQGLAGDTDK